MKISQLFEDKKVVYSFEIFPPKQDAPIESVFTSIDKLQALGPDYISVTYGAGGSARGRTCELASHITKQYGIPALAHLTCVHTSCEELSLTLKELYAHGLENVLALRGDRVKGREDCPGDFAHADELTRFIRQQGDFCVGGACYPEGHSEAVSLEEDLQNLKKKVDAGASFLTTQLFFDNEDYFSLVERAEKMGIQVPISAGIMPITTKSQVERMVVLSGAKIPGTLSRMVSKYGEDPAALRQAGINYAVGQIQELIAGGARGIHLYTMNRPETTRRITEAVRPLVDAANA